MSMGNTEEVDISSSKPYLLDSDREEDPPSIGKGGALIRFFSKEQPFNQESSNKLVQNSYRWILTQYHPNLGFI